MGYPEYPSEQLSSTASGHCTPSCPSLFLRSIPTPSVPTPSAKLLMNIGPKYQSAGIQRGFVGARRCICPYIMGVYTLRFPRADSPPRPYTVTLVCPALIFRPCRTEACPSRALAPFGRDESTPRA